MFFSDVLVSLRLVSRAGFFWFFLVFLVFLVFVVLMSAEFSARQPATVSLDIGFSVIRLVSPLVIVLLVQELISREFEGRHFLRSLTYPRGRLGFLLARFFSVLIVLFFLVMALGFVQVLLVRFVSNTYLQATSVLLGQPFLIVFSFMALDFLVLAALATLLAVVASTPSFVLIGTFGFMLVARTYGTIIELLSRDTGVVGNAENYRASLGVLGYLLPDLGALDLRMLALYGKPEFLPADWPWLVLSSLAYAVSLLALAVWALQRKRFA